MLSISLMYKGFPGELEGRGNGEVVLQITK